MPASNTTPHLSAAARAAADPAAAGIGSASGPTHLIVDGVSHAYGDRRVLSDISFTARPGDRIGLIGENGTGKSTLLGIIAAAGADARSADPAADPRHAAARNAGSDAERNAGRAAARDAGCPTRRGTALHPDAGAVALPGSVGLLAQQLPYPDTTPLAVVLDDAQRGALDALSLLEHCGKRMAAQPNDPGTAEAFARALEDAERSQAWSAAARRGEMLAGLGLGGIPEQRPIGELSGGQRLRLSLAALLLEAPQTLLLDEPSNHLDDASAAYLERVLIDWPGIVIVASHDRALLDAVSTRILDLDALPLPARVLADAKDANTEHAAGPTAGGSRTDPRRDPGSLPTDPATDDPGAGFGVRLWGVGYSAARAARGAEMERWRARYAAETAEREALVHEIEVGSREVNRKHESKSEAKITRKFYADKDARVTARRARNARVRLDALERERVRRPPAPLRFEGFGAPRDTGPLEPGRRGALTGRGAPAGASAPGEATAAPPSLIRAERLSLAGRLRATSLELAPGGRLMLSGPNGSGKSTLLAILARRLTPDRGELEIAPRARVGYLPQEVEFADPDRPAERAYRDAVGAEIAEAVPLPDTGLLARRDLRRPVGALSVGQRRRLALAALVADPPEVLLLDEPTNHLSLTLVEELETALRDFTAAPEACTGLVIATHDRWLRSRWEGAVLELDAV
ncbi:MULTISPECIES: ATP-binding cassette domain-containing protein [unclassified Leucobacter]|uniref:ATP-binding cassette domain-containing protein n=1 Tax=unclassified Leucobacter TaxID=2621730 RepID=UPI0030182D5D